MALFFDKRRVGGKAGGRKKEGDQRRSLLHARAEIPKKQMSIPSFLPLSLPPSSYAYLISCPIGVVLMPKGKGARPRPSRTCSASAGGSHLGEEGREGGKEGQRVFECERVLKGK
jgi:hypothetical protein